MSLKLPVSTVIAAIDLEDDLSDAVMKSAATLAEQFGAELHIIDVWPKLDNVGYPYARLAETAELKQYQQRRDQRRGALELKAKPYAPKAITLAPIGETTDTITRYLEDMHADLLVLGTHQKGFWGRLFSGSVSEEAVHDAPCAVFLVTPPFAKQVEKDASAISAL